MSAVFLKIVNMSFVASWLILAVILLRLALKKAPKWITCVLWALVAIRLVCPFSPESKLSVIRNQEPVTQEIVDTILPEVSFETPGNREQNGWQETTKTPEDVQVPAAHALNGAGVTAGIWVLGVVLLLSAAGVSYGRLRRRVRSSLHLRDNIWLCDEIATPFLLGAFRPKIYIPSGIDESSLPPIIAHENAHLKRRDHWWKPLGFLILSIHWFNPLIWLAYILLCRDIEFACDEKVIRDLGKEESIAYSEALLSCSVSRRTILVCPLAFGEVGVKERVKRVLHYKKPAFWIVVVAVVTSVVLAVCFLTNPHSFPVDLASIQISEASTMDLRTSSGPKIHQLSTVETEELSSRLKDLRVRQKDQDLQGLSPFYSLYVDTMEQGRITFSGFNDDGTHTAVLYDNVYYRITNSDFSQYLQRICAVGSRSAAVSSPFGRSYHVEEIVYSDPIYNFAYTLKTAPLYELAGDKELLICENKNDMIWLNAGTFREITLREDDFAACFRDFDDMGWNEMDASILVEENQQAWQLAVADQAANTVIYDLLLQKNGDVYLTYGYSGAANSGGTELSSIRWVFKLAEGLEAAPMSDESSGVIDASLDEAIQTAVQQHYAPNMPDGLIHVESYKILSQQEMSGTPKVGQDDHMEKVTVYLLVLHESFRPDSDPTQPIEEVGGDYIPTALTFRLIDGQYLLDKYWEPRDGGYYTDDIKSKFPEEAVQQVWDDQEIIQALQQANQEQVHRILQKQGSFEELAADLLNTICQSSNLSSNPGAYIQKAQEQYDELLGYGEATLRYCFRQFLEGGQTGLEGHIMAQLCRDIMEKQFGMAQLDMLYETGQAWFDAFYANSLEVAENVSLEDLEKYHPVSKLLLDMTGRDLA